MHMKPLYTMLGVLCIATPVFAATSTTGSTQASKPTSGSTKEAFSIMKDSATGYVNGKLSGWLSRTDITYAMDEDNKPVTGIETIQPLYLDAWHTVFWQGRFSYSNTSPTANLGLGYRYLNDSKNLMLGVNTFYDENTRFLHKRLGLGGEVFTPYVTVRGNYYDSLSGQMRVASDTYERALNGYDLSVETPVPYVPWMRFTLKGYHWEGVVASDVNGGLANLRIFPATQLEIDAGIAYDNSQYRQAFLSANYYFEKPAFIESSATSVPRLASDIPFAAQNLENMRLQKVIRQNSIVVEKTNLAGTSAIIVSRGT